MEQVFMKKVVLFLLVSKLWSTHCFEIQAFSPERVFFFLKQDFCSTKWNIWCSTTRVIDLWPSQDEVQHINKNQSERIQQERNKASPKWECGAEAREDAHHNAYYENDQHFGREVPCQVSHVNKSQEDGQA